MTTSRGAAAASADVVIVGGGVMGCASALALARRGARAVVLERSVPGAEASSAAAGMLAAQVEARADGPFFRLCMASRDRFPAWAELLRAETGIDVEHRACGVLRVATSHAEIAHMTEQLGWQSRAGFEGEVLGADAARAIEPRLAADVVGAVLLPRDARVDPPRLLRALRIAAERAGASFRTGATVRRILVESGRAAGVLLEDQEEVRGGHVVLAAGSWSSLVDGAPEEGRLVRPAKGQILELTTPVPWLGRTVFGEDAYICPRDDGRLLIGATTEFVGFARGTTAGAVHALLGAALRIVPSLGAAEWSRAWASFRPHTPSELPMMGPSTIDRLLLATGHFRNGILLAPITAEILAACVMGEAPPIDLAPFAPR